MNSGLRATLVCGTLALAGCSNGLGPIGKAPPASWVANAFSHVGRIHKDAIVLDSHVDIPFSFATKEDDPANRPDAQVDLTKLTKGDVDAAFFIVFVPQTARTSENYDIAYEQALTKFNAIRRMTDELYPDRSALALSASDVRGLHDSGRVAILIGIENGYPIGRDVGRLQEFYDLGARYMSLTHNGHNDLADSAIVRPDLNDLETEHGGLSALGRRAVREMNRLGMIVDVAHASQQTVLDIARLSRSPIISSHHALRHFVDIPRNLSDEEMKAIAGTGGVVQIVAFDTYVRPIDDERAAARATLAERYGVKSSLDFYALESSERKQYITDRRNLDRSFPRGTLSDLVDHIDYAVELVGIDHVGISSDFGGGGGVVGWDDAKQTKSVTKELVRRGYTPEEVRKLWGENLLRVLEAVENTAAR